MAIRRLRPKYSDEQLKQVYDQQYDHSKWYDHEKRIDETVKFALRTFGSFDIKVDSIADLSCGDGAIVDLLLFELPNFQNKVVLGDFTPGYPYEGKLEHTLDQFIEDHREGVDLYVLSETLEHLDEPGYILNKITQCAKYILLTTPCNETLENPEHYWSWGSEDIHNTLIETGWEPLAFELLEFEKLDVRYQFWIARRKED